MVAAERDMHQAGDELVGRGVLVKLDALHQRGSAVTDSDDGNADFFSLQS